MLSGNDPSLIKRRSGGKVVFGRSVVCVENGGCVQDLIGTALCVRANGDHVVRNQVQRVFVLEERPYVDISLRAHFSLI